jgi:hypothetical protein
MGFGDRSLKWIAVLLYTTNTKIMVNGVPGDRIHHPRGLRQGEPTSPLLFVAGMEVLKALIKKNFAFRFILQPCGNHTL